MSTTSPLEVVTMASAKVLDFLAVASFSSSSSTFLVDAVVLVVSVLVLVVSVEVVVEEVESVIDDVVELEAVEDALVLVEVESVIEDDIEVESVIEVEVSDIVSVIVSMVEHSENVPATQESVAVTVEVTVSVIVLVDVNVMERNRALPSAGVSRPDSTRSIMLLMYSWFLGGWTAGCPVDNDTKQTRFRKAFIVS